jgi:SAM-dependent methyltransferase
VSLKTLLAPSLEYTPINPLYIARNGIRRGLMEQRQYLRGRLLDIGCGRKPYAKFFDTKKYIGIEMPGTLSNSTVVDVFASGLYLPFTAAAFDSILSTEVLEHVPEPKLFFKEASRVLKNGGYLLLSTPQTWGLHEIPHDYYRYTPYGLRYLAEANGFKVVTVRATCGLWATFGQRISSFLFHRYAKDRWLIVQMLWSGVCCIVQLAALTVDWWYDRVGDTLDNVVLAQKIAESSSPQEARVS